MWNGTLDKYASIKEGVLVDRRKYDYLIYMFEKDIKMMLICSICCNIIVNSFVWVWVIYLFIFFFKSEKDIYKAVTKMYTH